ncbi:hypothetical protein [uncultured Microbacterium sp.]|uniref:hypothetical protein n=1 Tax=uncultured Microbacterium sp. TaxID=191216 RepID=UPI0028D4D125|nr:hypothetical protein [uncultured Microbacterium sp.]
MTDITNNIPPSPSEYRGPSRRQVIKTAAWAAPVIALATAAPASAAQSSLAVIISVVKVAEVYDKGKTTWTYKVTVENPAQNKSSATPQISLSVSGGAVASQTPASPTNVFQPTVAQGATDSSGTVLTISVSGAKTVTVNPTVVFVGEQFPSTLNGLTLTSKA